MDQSKVKEEPGRPKVKPEVILKAEPDDISASQINLSSIRSAIDESNTPALERAVEKGLALLSELLPHIQDLALLDTKSTARTDDARKWVLKIGEIFSLMRPTRTVIGVVGPTGAGKSSLINALLDEEQ